MKLCTRKDAAGFSILEVLMVMVLFGILASVGVSNISILENPLASASANLTHHFRLVRSRAISQTRSIKVTPSSTTTLAAESAANCNETTFTPVTDLALDLGDEVHFGTTDWSACFTQRGLANEYVTFTVIGSGHTKTVQIALGGGVKIQ